MALTSDHLLRILDEAQRPLGIKELMRLGVIHPGAQTQVKRLLRDLLRSGEVRKDGKRFVLPGVVLGPERAGGGADDDDGDAPRGPRRSEPSGGGRPQGTAPAKRRGPPSAEAPAASGRRRGPVERSAPGAGGRGTRGSASRAPLKGRGAAVPSGGGRRTTAGEGRDRAFDSGGSRRGGVGGRSAGGRPPFGSEKTKRMEGTLRMHRDGFGFVDSGDKDQENIFVPPHEAARALDNDKVIVEFPDRPGRKEGRIVGLVERRRQHVVGEYFEQGSRAWVEARENSLGTVRVARTQLARPGDLVKVRLGVGAELLGPGEGLFGEVAGSIGKPGDPSAEVLSIAFAQGFNDEFPPEVMDQADAISLQISDEDFESDGRRDLRAMPLVTIDGEDARDFDDAVWAEQTSGGWRLVVAIADVSHYVVPGTPLDDEAYSRATSVYLPDRVLPMLPERLSNGICSLKPDEDRMCMVADMQIDRGGRLGAYEIYAGVMRSKARCTYNEVHKVLSGEDVPHRNHLKPQFQILDALSKTLTKMRMERGAIDFDLPETKVVMGEDGLPARMEKRDRLQSHRLIEECMLAANEAVAKYFQENELPSVYRYHGDPDEEKLATFAQLAELHGFYLGDRGDISSKDLNDLVQKLAGHPEARALNQLLLRSMMQAVYSAENVGHYGLGAEHYLHFTSPIRRYPDLIVHRLLKQHWARKKKRRSESESETETARLEQMAEHCSDRERAAMQVERQVVAFYSVLLMKGRVGEEFDATVAGIADFGFFVELDTEFVEGLVKGESVGPDFELDKNTYSLVYSNGLRIKVGQKLRVVLVSANLEQRKLEFEAVSLSGEDAERADEGAIDQFPDPEDEVAQRRAKQQQRGARNQAAGGRGGRFSRGGRPEHRRGAGAGAQPPAAPERFSRQERGGPGPQPRSRGEEQAPRPRPVSREDAAPPPRPSPREEDEGPLRLEDVEGGAADRDRAPSAGFDRLRNLGNRRDGGARRGAGGGFGGEGQQRGRPGREQPEGSTWHPLRDDSQRYKRPGPGGRGKGGGPKGSKGGSKGGGKGGGGGRRR